MAKIDTDVDLSWSEVVLTSVIRRSADIQKAALDLLLFGDTVIKRGETVGLKQQFYQAVYWFGSLLSQVMPVKLGDYPDKSVAGSAVAEALRGILDIGKRDTSNPKYDGYYASAREALAAWDKEHSNEEDTAKKEPIRVS